MSTDIEMAEMAISACIDSRGSQAFPLTDLFRQDACRKVLRLEQRLLAKNIHIKVDNGWLRATKSLEDFTDISKVWSY
jgi:hypothetical protein